MLKRTGKMQKGKPLRQFWNGITNYRMWGLAACYAYSFGVEVGLMPVVALALAKSAMWCLGHMSLSAESVLSTTFAMAAMQLYPPPFSFDYEHV